MTAIGLKTLAEIASVSPDNEKDITNNLLSIYSSNGTGERVKEERVNG